MEPTIAWQWQANCPSQQTLDDAFDLEGLEASAPKDIAHPQVLLHICPSFFQIYEHMVPHANITISL
jgi:hypothetical protein